MARRRSGNSIHARVYRLPYHAMDIGLKRPHVPNSSKSFRSTRAHVIAASVGLGALAGGAAYARHVHKIRNHTQRTHLKASAIKANPRHATVGKRTVRVRRGAHGKFAGSY